MQPVCFRQGEAVNAPQSWGETLQNRLRPISSMPDSVQYHPTGYQSTLRHSVEERMEVRLLAATPSTLGPLRNRYRGNDNWGVTVTLACTQCYGQESNEPLFSTCLILFQPGQLVRYDYANGYVRYSTFFVCVPTDVISLQLCTPKIAGV
jgi:hypothetical protein